MEEADPHTPQPTSLPTTASDAGGGDFAEITAAAAAHLFEAGRAFSGGSGGAWAPPSAADLQRQLPQYEIRTLIGRGGMGAVYRGTQRSLEREVAIKILPPEMAAQDAQFPERFQREGKAMARLNHPGIVAVFDAGETADGLLYFVMEYVEGIDVQAMLTARGPLPVAEVLPIVMHVCEALEFAHASGFIHRDIKPSNIMVDDRGRVKVADFGLARAMAVEGEGLTRDSMTICTAEFAAPEAFIPGETLDGRADLYSVGVMLYHLLTGQIPRGRFEGPSLRVPGLDPRIDAIVDRAMQADRERRYATAGELRADLELILNEPLAAMRSSQAAGPRVRNARPLIGVVIAAVVIIVAAGMIFRGPTRADFSHVPVIPTPAEVESSSSSAGVLGWKPAPFKLNPVLDNGFVHLVKFDFWRTNDLRITNGAVRALIAWQPELPGRNDYIKITARLHDNEHYYAYLTGPSVEVGVFQAGKVIPRKRWPVTPRPQPGEDIELQLACVGRHIAVWVRGQLVGTIDDETLKDAGEVSVQAGDGHVQNLEYLSLDDLSEARALTLLGIGAKLDSR